jgi:hypothetical protein
MDLSVYEEEKPEVREFITGFARIRKALTLNWKNAIKKPFESVRWIIALYLDEDPYYCWARLVHWVVLDYDFWDLIKYHQDYEAYGCNYCGKCN